MHLLLSFQIPSLRDIASEYELYMYLKDGTELCRMIGLVTTGQVLQGIVYRPNNISTLEEKNISRFLSHVEKELKLSDLFGRKNGSQILQTFANFHIVLSGLAKVSEKIQERDRDIRSFQSSGKATVVSYQTKKEEDKYKINKIHYNEQESENWQNIVKDEKSLTNLDFAVDEMIDFNNRFISEVLKPLKSFQQKNASHILTTHFFPIFQVDKLLELHRKLKEEFKMVVHDYTLIGPIFEGLKNEWLVYCQIATKTKHAINMYVDQVSNNSQVQKMIQDMEAEAQRRSMKCHSIKDLVYSERLSSWAIN